MAEVVKVGLVHVQDGRLLVARNEGRQLFYLPGGRQEPGESDADTLCREVLEELAVVVDPTSIRPVVTVEAPRDGTFGSLQMRCYTAVFTGTPVPSHEVVELAWVSATDGSRVTAAERALMVELTAAGLL
ncbi:NUDIX hydrolase [Angustibacter sp. McL0619]|uniref:NUDIX hydrolase n=1 Tax=Angustibacter sp. McL0619 TaxID=3415676 RepID=UPI003CEBB178